MNGKFILLVVVVFYSLIFLVSVDALPRQNQDPKEVSFEMNCIFLLIFS